MKALTLHIYSLTIALFLSLTIWAQADATATVPGKQDSSRTEASDTLVHENPLFTDEDVLHFKLKLNYEELLDDRGDVRGYHKATLTYTDTSGAPVNIDLKVMVRGNHRRNPDVCRFPPLMLNFSRKTTKGTVFEHVNKVKLVTHCQREDYVLKEYLVYKLYNTLTDKSFRARLCRITYEDLQAERKTEVKYAFLIEDDKEMAKRNKAAIIPKVLTFHMAETDPYYMAQLAVFQYMIGNTDWSVPYRHNIKLLSVDSLVKPVPVPYDFDYSGIVAPPYAVPPPELGITSVRQRLYRGYDFPDHIYAEVASTFKKHRSDIYNVYAKFPHLGKASKKQVLNYLDSFYEVLDDPKDFNNHIVRVGQKNKKSYVVVKGLK